MIEVIAIRPEEVPEVWPRVAQYFESVVDRISEYTTLEGIHNRIENGAYQLLVVLDGQDIKMAMVCEIVTCDTGNKIMMIPQLGGYDMGDWLQEIVDALYRLGHSMGCFKVMIAGARPGWAKVMKEHGGVVSHVTIEFDTQARLGKLGE